MPEPGDLSVPENTGSRSLPEVIGPAARPIRPSEVPVHAFEEQMEPAGVAHYWHTLWGRKWWLLFCSIAGAALGLAAVIIQPAVFSPRVTIEVQGFNEGFMNIGDVDPQAGTGMNTPTEINIQTQVEVLESRTLRQKATERILRESLPLSPPTPDFFTRVRAKLGVLSQDPIAFTNSSIQSAYETVKAKPLRNSRIVEVRCEAPSPEIAASFLNALATEYIDQALQARLSSVQRVSAWLSERLKEAKEKLEGSEGKWQSYVRQYGMAFPQQQNTLGESKLQQLQIELSTIQADRIAKEARYQTAQQSAPEALVNAIDDPNLRATQSRLTDLRRARAELVATLMPAHEKVVRIDAQIKEIEAVFEKERDDALRRLRTEYENALQREKLLSLAYSRQYGALSGQSNKALEYNLLKREVDTSRQLYEMLLKQLNQASVAVAAPTTGLRVVDAAFAPDKYSKPIPALYIPLGLVSGLLAGGFFVLFRQMVDRQLRDPRHSVILLDVPELGVIPSRTPRRLGSGLKLWRRRAEEHADTLVNIWQPDTGNGGSGQDWKSRRLPAPLWAESFRGVVASILFQHRDRQAPRMLVVTSPSPREGKTTLACNLAAVLAETFPRVLLVDADVRNPRLHKVFDLPLEPGLAQLIDADDSMIEPLVQSAVRTTALRGVFVLPAGGYLAALGKQIYSAKPGRLAEYLRTQFNVIVVDTPPILHAAETRVLGRISDGVILILRAGATDRTSALLARQRLAEDGTPVIGTILNDWQPRGSGYYRYAGYYYSGHHE